VSQAVTPKFRLLASPRAGGAVAYAAQLSSDLATNGAQCLADAVLMPATVADGIAVRPAG
jgi:hypothetical protein